MTPLESSQWTAGQVCPLDLMRDPRKKAETSIFQNLRDKFALLRHRYGQEYQPKIPLTFNTCLDFLSSIWLYLYHVSFTIFFLFLLFCPLHRLSSRAHSSPHWSLHRVQRSAGCHWCRASVGPQHNTKQQHSCSTCNPPYSMTDRPSLHTARQAVKLWGRVLRYCKSSRSNTCKISEQGSTDWN